MALYNWTIVGVLTEMPDWNRQIGYTLDGVIKRLASANVSWSLATITILADGKQINQLLRSLARNSRSEIFCFHMSA